MTCTLGMGTKEVMVVTPLLILAYDYIFAARSLRAALRTRPELYAGLVASWVVLAALTLTINLRVEVRSRCGHDIALELFQNAVDSGGALLATRRVAARACTGLFGLAPETALARALPGCGAIGRAVCRQCVGCPPSLVVGFLGRMVLPPAGTLFQSPAFAHRTRGRTENVPAPRGGDHRRAGRRRSSLSKSLGSIRLARPCASLSANQRCGRPGSHIRYRHDSEKCPISKCRIDLDRCRCQAPGSARGHANLGLALLDENRATESIPDFVDALRIDTGHPIVRCNLAAALAATGATNQAIAQLQETLRNAPDYAPAHTALADLLIDRGELKAALEHYGTALAINPDDQTAHFNLALLLTRLGQREAAITQYTEVLRLDPRNATAHYNLANLLAETGRDTEAISHYAAAARFDPRNARSQINLGNLFLKQDRLDDAIAAYTAALRADPTAFKAHNNLAVVLANRGDLVGATAHLREAVRLKPELPEVHSELAEVLERQGLHEEAQRQIAEAHRLKPADSSH